MIEPTPEEFRGWLEQSCGKYFRESLRERITSYQDDWSSGMFNSKENKEESQIANSEALGRVQEIGEILMILEELSTDETTEDNETE